MEVSSVSPRVPPPGNLGRGWFFCAKSPTLGDKLLSNFPRGRGGAMGRGSFHAKVLVLFIKNGRLPLQLIEKTIRWKCRRTFWERFVVVFVTYRHKWLTENSRWHRCNSQYESTKKYDSHTSLSFSSPTSPWCSKRLH